jgi:prefoldin subunit 5
MDESLEQLRKEIERLTRRIEALQAQIAQTQSASRFGYEMEMRERGHL